jgi:hypothetical protein
MNKSGKNFSVYVDEQGHYSKFYLLLNQRLHRKTWRPKLPDHRPLSVGAPFSIIRHSDQFIKITHSRPKDIPAILKHCEKLWRKALAARNPRKSMQYIAELEWWFFAANPTGRCGASLGTCLSLILQLRTEQNMPSYFRHLDWYSLSHDLSAYSDWRIRTFFKTKYV